MSFVPLSRVLTKISPSVNVEPGSSYPNAGVLNRGRGLFAKPPLAGGATAATKLYRLSAGNVVYSKLFAWEGSVALVSDEFDGSYVSSEFPIFEVDQEAADLRYLYHALTWSKTLEQISAMGSGLGQRRQRVNPDRFVTAEIPLPPLADQRRIAAHLDSAGEASGALGEAAIRRRSALEELRARDWGGAEYAVGDLLCEVSRPRSVDGQALYRMAGVRWYGEGVFLRETKRGRELAANTVYELEPGDLVYNRLFAWKQSFALVAEGGLTVSNEFPAFRVQSKKTLPEVLAQLLLSRDFTAQVNAASSGSTPTSRNRLKVKDFLGLRVRVPDEGAQRRMAEIFRLVARVDIQAQRAAAVATALLPAARNEVFSRLR